MTNAPTPPSDESPVGERKPIKLHFSNELLREQIASDPDDAEYEVGVSHYDAPRQRFFVEHGIVHDRKTEKHVRGCNCVTLDGTAEETATLLNSLAIPQPERVTEAATMVHVVICCNPDGSEVRHIFSSADKAQEYADADPRNHVLYDYLLDCPERHEGRAQ